MAADPAADRLAAAICAAGRRLGTRGLIAASEGNLSARFDGDRLLMTPSGRRKDELAPSDLVEVTIDAAAVAADARPSSDLAIHRAIYRARPDVLAIVHAHLPVSMALTLAGEVPDPAALPETAHFIPVLPLIPFLPMGSEELGAAVAGALTSGSPRPVAVLLERHGAIAVGDDPAAETPAGTRDADRAPAALVQAVNRLELVDVLCRVWRDATLLRAARGGRTGAPSG